MATNQVGTIGVGVEVDASDVPKDLAKQLDGKKFGGIGTTIADAVGTTMKVGIGAAAAGIGATLGATLFAGFNRLTSIDNAKSKLEGLKFSGEQIESVMASALAAVDKTAYGLGEAASVAGIFAATGIKAGDDMTRALKLTADAATVGGTSMQDMGDVISEVSALGKVTGDTLNRMGARGIDALGAIATQMGVSRDEAREMVSAGEIDFNEFAAAMEANIGGAALSSGKTFQGAMANIMAATGRLGAVALTPAFEGMIALAPHIISLLNRMTAALTPIMEVIGPKVTSAFEAIGGALDKINFAQLTPLGILSSLKPEALAEGFNKLLSVLPAVIDKMVAGIAEMLPKMLAGLATNIPILVNGILMLGANLLGAIVNLVPVLVEAFSDFIPQLVDSLTAMIPTLGIVIAVIVRALLGVIPELITGLLGAVPDLLDAALDLFGALVDAVVTIVPPVLGAVINIVPQIVRALLSALPDIIDAGVKLLLGLVEAAVATIPVLIDTLSRMIPSVIDMLISMVPVLLDAALDMWTSLADSLIIVIPKIITALMDMLPKLIESMLGMYPQMIDAALTLFQSLVTGLMTALPIVIDVLTGEWIPMLIETVIGMIPTLLDAGVQLFMGLVQALSEAIPTLISGVMEMLPPLIAAILAMVPKLIDAAITLFLALVTGVVEALPLIIDAVVGMLPVLITAVMDMLPELIDASIQLFLGIIVGVVEAAPLIIAAVIGLIPKLIEALIRLLPLLIGAGIQLIVGLITGIIGAIPQLIGAFGEIFMNLMALIPAPIADSFKLAWEQITDALTWVYENVIKPVFEAIANVVGFVALGIKTWIDIIVGVFRFLGAVVTWLWENAVAPVLDLIGKGFEILWKAVVQPVIDFIVLAIEGFGIVMQWLYDNVVKPVMDGIAAAFQWVWDNVIAPVIGFISDAIEGLGIVFNWLYENVVKPVWEGITDVIEGAWKWIDEHVFSPFETAIADIQTAFQNVANALPAIWATIKAAVAEPINFVLIEIWNKGLLKFWNGLVDELKLPDMKLPEAQRISFAKGGVLPGYTPGRDVHRFFSPTGGRLDLSGGEGIIRPDALRALGGKRWLDAVNGSKGRGIGDGPGDAGGLAGDVWDWLQKSVQGAWDFFVDPMGSIKKYIIDGIIKPGVKDQNIFGKTIGGVAANFFMGFEQMFKDASPASRGTAGMGWEKMWAIVKQFVPGATLNDALRPAGTTTAGGGLSFHGMGRAIDIGPANMATFNAVAKLFPNATELIFTPAGNRQLQGGSPTTWGGAVAAMHWDHIHLAMKKGGIFDKGGWLGAGALGMNMSGRPEAVFSAAQFDVLERNVTEIDSLLAAVRGYRTQDVRGYRAAEAAAASMAGTSTTFQDGAIRVDGSGDPYKAALLVVDEIAERVGL